MIPKLPDDTVFTLIRIEGRTEVYEGARYTCYLTLLRPDDGLMYLGHKTNFIGLVRSSKAILRFRVEFKRPRYKYVTFNVSS